MAKLTVQAAPFSIPVSLKWTTTPLHVSLSVSDESGNPVEGLKDSEFGIIKGLAMPAVGEEVPPMDVEIADTYHHGGGFYSVQIAPSTASKSPQWEAGRYVVGLTVNDKRVAPSRDRPGSSPIQAAEFTTDNGQTLVTWHIA